MSELIKLLERPEMLVGCSALLLVLMMLMAIMLRMSRRDRDTERRMDELQHAMNSRMDDSRAASEAQLRETADGLRRSVEELSDGVTRALVENERGQNGRMDQYADRLGRSAQAEAERSRAFSDSVQRRMDELQARIEQSDAQTARRMTELGDDIARRTAREVSAQLDGALGELRAQLTGLSAELGRLNGAADELRRLQAGNRPQSAIPQEQLDALLMQWLSPGRYVRRFEVGTGSGHYADIAILLPDEAGQMLYLPVDASFSASEFAGEWSEDMRRRLGESVTAHARRVAGELIKPGLTTDFALLLISSELVSARVYEQEELMQDMQQSLRVIPVGPAAFWAMVRALEGGINALAMQRRSQEIEHLLEEVRSELGRFSHMISAGQSPAPAEQAPADAPQPADDISTAAPAADKGAAPLRAAPGGESELDIWN